MHRIAVISDTHGLLRPEVLEQLKGCEMILHGGDIDRQSILNTLEQIVPVHAVRGNADKEWAASLPATLSLELYGIKIFMIHNKKQLPKELPDADVIIYGHSHKYEEQREGGRLWLNPGSCGPRRFTLPITMAILEIGGDGSLRVEKIDLPHQKTQTRQQREAFPPDIKSVIETVMRDAQHGRSIDEIARRNHIEKELAEQICRMYFTHPGVDADGIMTKLGI